MNQQDDPTRCALPHCLWRANGRDWIVGTNTRGETFRMGFCSQYHLHIAVYFLGSLVAELGLDVIAESDPRDNYEDRPWLHEAMRDRCNIPGWPAAMKHRGEDH